MALNVCPFDGADVQVVPISNNKGQPTYSAICPVCRVQTPDFMHVANLETYWNTRSEGSIIPLWDAEETGYQGTSPASLVEWEGKTYVGSSPVTGSAPGTVGSEWLLTTFSAAPAWDVAKDDYIGTSVADMVSYDGNVYIAIAPVTGSAPGMAPGEWAQQALLIPPAWDVAENNYQGTSVASYASYDGDIYVALDPQTGSAPGVVRGEWLLTTIPIIPAWDVAETTYQATSPASLVSYGGHIYVAVAPITGSAPAVVPGEWMLTDFADISAWDISESAYKGQATASVVSYAGGVYLCVNPVTGTYPGLVAGEWTRVASGIPEWSAELTTYQGTSTASVVSYEGATYIAVDPITAAAPGTVAGQWTQISPSVAAWDAETTTYQGTSPASLVTYHSDLYVALAPVTGSAPGEVESEWILTT